MFIEVERCRESQFTTVQALQPCNAQQDVSVWRTHKYSKTVASGNAHWSLHLRSSLSSRLCTLLLIMSRVALSSGPHQAFRSKCHEFVGCNDLPTTQSELSGDANHIADAYAVTV